MNDGKLERLFKWIDFVRVLLYVLVAGAVAVAVWCTKIQMSVNETKLDVDIAQGTATHYRDIRSAESVILEHRLTELENNMEWLKKRVR